MDVSNPWCKGLRRTYQHKIRHCCCRQTWHCSRSGCTTVCRSAACMSDSSLDRLQRTTINNNTYCFTSNSISMATYLPRRRLMNTACPFVCVGSMPVGATAEKLPSSNWNRYNLVETSVMVNRRFRCYLTMWFWLLLPELMPAAWFCSTVDIV